MLEHFEEQGERIASAARLTGLRTRRARSVYNTCGIGSATAALPPLSNLGALRLAAPPASRRCLGDLYTHVTCVQLGTRTAR